MKKNNYFLFLLLLILFPLKVSAESEKNIHLHIVDYDNPISFEEIKSRYKSYDFLDGDITSIIQFQSSYEDAFKKNALEVKTYDLIVSVTNSRNYTTQWLDAIEVRDFTSPTLEATQNEITIDISTEQVEKAILQFVNIEDNWDNQFENMFWEGIENCEKGPGSYIVTLWVQDTAGNLSNSISMTIHIIESIQERIASHSITIEKGDLNSSEILTEFLRLNQINLSYKKIEVTSSYFDSPHKNGIYPATIIFYGNEGKEAIYHCKIIVNLKDEKKKDDKIIYISSGIILFLLGIGIVIYRKRR